MTNDNQPLQPTSQKSPRAHSLDALRGYAIMTMILSATEAFKVLPRWMYHAQVPPPDHVFNPTIFGITWVDLIFPFFLFSMGAAFPLSLGRQYAKGVSKAKLCYKSVLRWLKLCFFAIYIAHLFPYMLGYSNPNIGYIVAFCGFLLMFPMYLKSPFHTQKPWSTIINGACYIIGFAWIYFQPYQGGKPFSFSDTDIIILILANVAVVGSIIYVYTMKNLLARLAVLPIILGIILSAQTDGSWAKEVLNFTPAHFMYEFRFLEYLLIIIPGTIAGDLLSKWLSEKKEENAAATEMSSKNKIEIPIAMTLSFLLIICNVCCLYNRWMVANLFISAILLVALHYLLRSDNSDMRFWHRLYTYGAYFLMAGLCFEAFQGGIRKDDVTVSYLLVTSGLAFIALIFFSIIGDYYKCKWISTSLELTGKNPMIAYVSDSLVVVPLLMLSGLYNNVLVPMEQTAWPGFIKGIIVTAICMLVTSLFTKLRLFWKT